jgi:hypothetical protein
MTVADVISFVRGIINSPVEGYLTNAEIVDWINDAYREFYSHEGKESIWTYTAHRGDIEVKFDPNIIRVADLYLVDDNGTKHDIKEVEYQIFADTIMFNEPIEYDGTYYVLGYCIPVMIDATEEDYADTEIDMPVGYEDYVKKYALANAYLKDEAFQLYQLQMAMAQQRKAEYYSRNRKKNERKYIDIERK